MSGRIKAINKYYTELKYNIISQKTAKYLINLDIGLKLKDIKNLPERFFETASLIEQNFSVFVSLCEHVDVVTTLIEYLNYYGAKFLFESNEPNTVETCKNTYIPLTLILTIYAMCRQEVLIPFLERAIIDDSVKIFESDSSLIMSGIHTYVKCMTDNLNQANEMIILEDSDLHAVINCLMIIDNSCLSKIWIQKSIKQEFLIFEKKYLNYFIKCPIGIFQSQQELLTISTPRKCIMSMISIWSEDIVAAKNLALCFDRDIVFINTHMDFTGGLLFVPFAKKLDNLMNHAIMNSFDETNIHTNDILPNVNNIAMYSDEYLNCSKIINLFYDGIWQQPIQNLYFKLNDEIFANATNEDIRKCIKSAKKGLKIWGANSIISRKVILSKLAITLSYNRQITLSNLVERCIEFATFYENSFGYCTQDENLELTNSAKAKGIIILREADENILFLRLTQSLLAGNSIIVICNENFCNIKPYMYMFSMCDIPPGVINMLSSECIMDLESRLCGTKYSIYASRYFSEEDRFKKNKNPYINLTLMKHIVHLLK